MLRFFTCNENRYGGGYNSIKHFSDRLLQLLLIFEPVSIVLRAVIFALEGRSVIYIFLRVLQSVVFYQYGALWYIQAMVVGVWIIYFIVLKKKKVVLGFFFGFVLFLIALICNSYYFLVKDTVVGNGVNLYLKVAVSARNGIFYGFFVLLVGMLAYQIHKNNRVSNKMVVTLFFVCYGLYLFELFSLKSKTMKDDGSIFIMSIPVTLCLLFMSVNHRTNSGKSILLRNLSTGVYLLHRPILYLLSITQMIANIELSHTVIFSIVSISAVAICIIAYRGNFRVSRYLK